MRCLVLSGETEILHSVVLAATEIQQGVVSGGAYREGFRPEGSRFR